MATKQITQLDLATSFAPGDLMLVRKTGEAVDKAVSQQVMLQSIGATAVVGFKSASTESNKVVLTPTNGGAVDQYYDQMTVSFISPITSTSDVQIGVANLASKQLQEINTSTATALVTGKYYEAIYDKTVDKFYHTNTSIASVSGYIADSTQANSVFITSSNGAKVDQYYDQMTVSFISPINSTAPQVRITGLTYKPLQEINTTVASTLVTGKYYEAIYDKTADKFYQTNVSKPYIFTNEYIAVGQVQQGGVSTKYALTSAIGETKTNYYKSMSAQFTTDIASKGAIIVNVDGLGEKSLLDPEGDQIASDLLANEAVLAIYDGTVFRKHMYNNIEPPAPEDVTVTVGTDGNFITIGSAINGLVNQYGNSGGGRNATIQLLPGYIYIGERIFRNTPWITVKSTDEGSIIDAAFKIESPAALNFTGKFNCRQAFINIDYTIGGIQTGTNIYVKDATVINLNPNSNPTCIYGNYNIGRASTPNLTFNNVNVTSFGQLYAELGNYTGPTKNGLFVYDTGSVAINNNYPSLVHPLIVNSNVILKNVSFGNVTRANQDASMFLVTSGSVTFTNVTLTSNETISALYVGSASTDQSTLINCTIKHTGINSFPVIRSAGQLVIDGGDYRHTQAGASADILAMDFVGAVVKLRNTPLGSTRADGRGQIVIE